MNTVTSQGFAVLAVGAGMIGGIYAIAVLDRLLALTVEGSRVRWGMLVAAPARYAALLLLQQQRVTERPDTSGWALAPAFYAGLAAVALALVPLRSDLVAANPATGFVVFSAAITFVMIAVFLHGWSPNSAFPLHGAYRYAALGLSFLIPFLLAMLATVLPAESLSIVDIVEAQRGLWNVVREPLGLPLYMVVVLAVSFWGPLNVSDAADLAGGTSMEDAGAALLLWKAARSAMLLAVSAMGAAAFLGGWWGPWLPGPTWVVVKTVGLLVVLLAMGHLLARVRIERFVVVAWAVLIPLALVNVFIAGAFLL